MNRELVKLLSLLLERGQLITEEEGALKAKIIKELNMEPNANIKFSVPSQIYVKPSSTGTPDILC